MLSNSDLIELTALRRKLHRRPELSGHEVETAKTIAKELGLLAPTKVLTNIGGHGVAAVFDSGEEGPTVLFRAELDALPIQEQSNAKWASEIPGMGHMCGHDGHMMFLMGLGRLLSRKPVDKGRVVLMFQPSEEDGCGARAVISDPAYEEIRADWAFAIHIEPGRPWGYVSTRKGLINCASQGLKIKLSGKTAHAADPEDGISPSLAVAKIVPALDALGQGGKLDDDFRLVTVTHFQVGEPTFGTAPGDGVIFATLRSVSDHALTGIAKEARNLAAKAAGEAGLEIGFDVFDHFAASINDGDATDVAIAAMDKLGIQNGALGLPMRASEDFGVFGWVAKAAMLCLGPGKDYAPLHSPNYDFPDDLLPTGVAIFEQIARDLLGG
jgi:amidohydrolase